MRVVIAGGGNVGTFIADDLARAGHDVAIVEIDAERVAAAQANGEPPGVAWVVADACELSELARADLDQADVVAAVTGDDEDNLVISLLSKQEFAVPRVVARVNNPKNEWMFNEMWGVDVSVSTPHLLTALVEEAVSVGTLVRLLSFEGGKARLSEATLTDQSPSAGKDISELALPPRLHRRGRHPRQPRHRPPGRHVAALRRRGPGPHLTRSRIPGRVHPPRVGRRWLDPPDEEIAKARRLMSR